MRHAEVHNPQDIVYGRLPRFRLSDRGLQMADLAAQFVSTRDVAAIYSSPLLRARQTAAVIAARFPGLRVRSSWNLLETRTSYQGSSNEIHRTPGFSYYEPRKKESDESMQDIFARMSHFVRMAARRHAGGITVAVSHADPIVILRVGLEDKEFTARDLHAAVYPARLSVTQITLIPGQAPVLTYFNLTGLPA